MPTKTNTHRSTRGVNTGTGRLRGCLLLAHGCSAYSWLPCRWLGTLVSLGAGRRRRSQANVLGIVHASGLVAAARCRLVTAVGRARAGAADVSGHPHIRRPHDDGCTAAASPSLQRAGSLCVQRVGRCGRLGVGGRVAVVHLADLMVLHGVAGGIEPQVQCAGGHQARHLRLLARDGHQAAMRARVWAGCIVWAGRVGAGGWRRRRPIVHGDRRSRGVGNRQPEKGEGDGAGGRAGGGRASATARVGWAGHRWAARGWTGRGYGASSKRAMQGRSSSVSTAQLESLQPSPRCCH